MNLEWIAEAEDKTIAHATKLKIDGITAISPLHALTSKDREIAGRAGRFSELGDTNIIVAGESLGHSTFNGVGRSTSITEALFQRLKSKMIEDKINLVHTRIPEQYKIGDRKVNIGGVGELQTSGLVGIQLEAKASVIIPPLNSGLISASVFKSVYERTKTEIQTFNKKEKEIVGYIPTTQQLSIIPEMIETYIKDGIRFFAVDFSSSPLNRWLIRAVVGKIRETLKIKDKVGEKTDKQYYLHVFDVSSNRRTITPVAPITDVLTHAYGVDSTSGVIWGGGKLKKEKLRYFNMQDYGAYQIQSLEKFDIKCEKGLTEGNAIQVYEKLRAHRLAGYKRECQNISKSMGNGDESGYAPYLLSKVRAVKEVKNIFMDIQEIKARS